MSFSDKFEQIALWSEALFNQVGKQRQSTNRY